MIPRISTRAALAAGVTIGLAGVLATAMYAQSQPAPRGERPGFGMMHGGRMGPMGWMGAGFRQLNLTDQQREQVRGIMQQHEPEFRQLGDRAMAARKALQDATFADTIDEAAIRDRSAALAAVEADGAVLHAKVRAEIWQQVLTPEQREKAKTLQAEMQQRMQQRHRRQGPGQF